MKCWICAEKGVDTDAVAVCTLCGMGLCREHAIREEIPVQEGGYPFPLTKGQKSLPRILCPECSTACGGSGTCHF